LDAGRFNRPLEILNNAVLYHFLIETSSPCSWMPFQSLHRVDDSTPLDWQGTLDKGRDQQISRCKKLNQRKKEIANKKAFQRKELDTIKQRLMFQG
jgi:hypothetical protein